MSAAVQDAIMLFGDSLTQGAWEFDGIAQRLARRYDPCQVIILLTLFPIEVYVRKLDVLNRGLSSYNTDYAIPIFEQVSPDHAHLCEWARPLTLRY
jgi:hypothetical protein